MAVSVEMVLSPFHSPPLEATVWNRLLSHISHPTPFATWEWQDLWWRHFSNQHPLSVLLIREEGEAIGIAPFYQGKEGYLMFIGGEDLSDYLDILAMKGKESMVWTQVLDYLEASPVKARGLDLHCIPSTSSTLEILPSIAGDKGYRVKVEIEEVCPVLRLPGNWEGYLSTLSQKDRHELRRKIRRAEKAFPPLRFRHCSEEECARQDIRSFISLHRKSTPEKGIFMDGPMESFFHEISHAFAQKNWLSLYVLERDQKAVAAMLCFDLGDTTYLYNSGYDPEYSALSPGIVLIGYCVKDAISRGKGSFDFLRGQETYKYRLGAKDRAIYRILLERE